MRIPLALDGSNRLRNSVLEELRLMVRRHLQAAETDTDL
jgi:hypothetical protein